ncbi:phage tail protein [Xenorhabdus ishibashii]|uniref:Phage tail protein n=1 Tax=Xenorhabdus ishibashii TaxID=1034471 RepID=A0A2D0KK21_9GAMM|nr:phage tail protein [Xenorhabdus ishibashii]
MSIEEFKWRTQIQDSPSGEFKHRIKSIEFRDGYKQISADDINPESQSWSYSYIGVKEEVWFEAADLIIKGMEGAIAAKTVTYDFERLMDVSKFLKCIDLCDAIISYV